MKEEYVSFELAKKLREKGYPQSRSGKYDMKGACYFEDGRFYEDGCIANVEDCFTAPTIPQVLTWLITEKKRYVFVDFFLFNGNTQTIWTFTIRNIIDGSTYCVCEVCRCNSYKEAEVAGIEYVLDNLI